MHNTDGIKRVIRTFTAALTLFISGTCNAGAYNAYHVGYGIGHYGYHSHYGLHAGYSSHGGIGTAGYVILGLFGAVLLSHFLNNDNHQNDGTYHRTYPVTAPTVYKQAKTPARYTTPVYQYDHHEGWDALVNGNAGFALDIFAIQTQQDMGNGIPRIGFALAAAVKGEQERSIRALRKAISIDPYALINIKPDEELQLTIQLLIEEYSNYLNNDVDYDYSFMLATLACLNQDFESARNVLASSDRSQSANNLREILNHMP